MDFAMLRWIASLAIGVAACMPIVVEETSAATFAVAGVPKPIGEAADYDTLFATLRASGITAFFPTFQYVEAPAPESVGREVDFIAPCSRDDPAFAAMRRHGIQLIVPSNLLYDPAAPLPPVASDPLAALMACSGRDGLYGILSFDEPGYSGVSEDRTAALYQRVNQIAPGLPVLMVHGPLVIDPGRHDTVRAQLRYLDEVRAHSQHADIVGFSTYPVPPVVARMGAPGSGVEVVDHVTAARGYMSWLRTELPGRGRMAVLQAFSYADQYAPELLVQVASPELIAMVGPPTETELEEMARESLAGGADLIVWYGANFAKTADDPGWLGVLSVSRRLSGAN